MSAGVEARKKPDPIIRTDFRPAADRGRSQPILFRQPTAADVHLNSNRRINRYANEFRTRQFTRQLGRTGVLADDFRRNSNRRHLNQTLNRP